MKLPQVIERIRGSVVQVAHRAPGNPLSPLGTGFIVNSEGFVVTAKHVIDALPTDSQLLVHFALPNVDTPSMKMRGNFVATEAAVIGTDADNDLALITVPAPPSNIPAISIGDRTVTIDPVPIKPKLETPPDGTPIAASGYPLREPTLVTTAGIIATGWTVPDPTSFPTPADRYLADLTANPGNSGGPVYTAEEGALVGVLVAGRLTPVVGGQGHSAAGLTLIVPAPAVAALLDHHGVEWQLPAAPNRRQTHPSPRRRKR